MLGEHEGTRGARIPTELLPLKVTTDMQTYVCIQSQQFNNLTNIVVNVKHRPLLFD